MITADEAHGISITGEGVIDGNGMSFVEELPKEKWGRWRYDRVGGFSQQVGRPAEPQRGAGGERLILRQAQAGQFVPQGFREFVDGLHAIISSIVPIVRDFGREGNAGREIRASSAQRKRLPLRTAS